VLLAAVCVAACLMAGGAGAAPKQRSPATESLFLAIKANDIGAVKASLLGGADVDAENDAGRTPIDVAVDLGNFSIAHYLLAWRKHQAAQRERKAAVAAAPPPRPEPQPAPQAPVEPTPPVEAAAKPPVGVLALAPALPAFEPKAEAPRATAAGAATAPAAGTGIAPPSEVRQGPGTPGRIGGVVGEQTAAVQPAVAPASSPAEPATTAKEPGNLLQAIIDFFTVVQPPEQAAPTASATAAAARPAPPPAEATPAAAVAGPDKGNTDSLLDGVLKVLAEAQQQQETSNRPRETAAADSRTAKPAAAPSKQSATPAPAKAGPPPEITPAAPPAVEAARSEGPGEILGRITEFIFVRPKSPPATAKPAAAAAAVAAQPTAAEQPPTGGTTEGPAAVAGAAAATASAEIKRAAVEPAIGNATRIGKPPPADGGDGCIEKGGTKTRICIEPIDWPPGVADLMTAESGVYRGRQAIVRYDDGIATQFHVLFPTGNFAAVEDYFTKRLGPPGARPDLWVPMIGSANRKNRAVTWLGPRPAGGGEGTTLEIREFDDLRWSSPPDMTHGVVRLYGAVDEAVFKHVSWSDFLLVKMRRDPH
jgi:hypothetical protein